MAEKEQFARRYGFCERTIQAFMDRGLIPYYKIGYAVRLDPAECDRAMERHGLNANPAGEDVPA